MYVKFQAVSEKTAKIVGKLFFAALTCIENHASDPGVVTTDAKLQFLLQNIAKERETNAEAKLTTAVIS